MELEHLKTKTRLIDEKFASVKGEYEICVVVYYESIKRELEIRCIYECRCDERLKPNLKVRNLHDSHTLGCSGNWNT